jgi:molecular chaperone DnaK
MDRTTIDYGIDLGTTNSAIAVLRGVSVEIIKNNSDADITPSAVSFRKNTLHVGERAKGQLIEFPDDAYSEFKRRMGTDYIYQFKTSGTSKRPEELSAEVLKSLRADVQQRTGEVIDAAVITVPAAFELHQCDATRKAAQLAGFRQSPLLQEPVAAALAFGFQIEKQKAYWLVYDFGGGTFDAAVIKAEEGTIQVVNHGGDNFLGGSDMDWAIVKNILVPRLQKAHALKDFSVGNPHWRSAFAILKRAAEVAKMDLSRRERVAVDARFSAANGDDIEFECELTRAEVTAAAEPFIQRSVDICKNVLTEKNLRKGAVERVILVGGPTLAPYFRERLTKGLGIPLDHRVDPLTVVARGAAIFAGTQRLDRLYVAQVPLGQYSIDLKHKPVGIDSAPIVGGKILSSAAQDLSGFTLELTNVKTKWSSGKIAIGPDGVFVAHLHAERGERNVFSIALLDSNGRRQKTSPDVLTYTIGAVVEEQPLINSMGIALGNNEYDKLFEKGRGLPLKGTSTYHTIVPIRKGKQADICKIPVVEGENARADRNRWVGELEIKGENISRDVPVGSEIEVTLHIDTSRIITVGAYVPVLDQEFRGTVDLKMHSQDLASLQRDYDTEMSRFREVKAKAANAGGQTAESLIRVAEQSPRRQEGGELLQAKGDPGAAAKCEKRLLELKIKLDEAADALEWPALVSEARQSLQDLVEVDKEHGTSEQHQRAAKLVEESERLIRLEYTEDLRRKMVQVRALWWELISAQPAFWVYHLQQLESQVDLMSDQPRATRLLDQGRAFLSQNNLVGLQNVVRELWNLLPVEAAREAKRGYQAGVVKVR